MNEEPLIWTSKGNLPISSLEYRTEWINSEDFITFSEYHLLDGEIVKASTHAYKKEGTLILSSIQEI